MIASGSWRVRSQDAELAVTEVAGHHLDEPRAGSVAVLAHGAGSSARFIAAAFAGPLATTGLRLVTYDLRGHGASSPARSVADHHLDAHAADLAAVVASVDAEVAVIGGVSLGAHAAVRAVAGGAVGGAAVGDLARRGAVLACLPGWTGRSRPGAGPHAALAEEVHHLGVDGVIARLRSEPGLPRWLRETLLADYPRHDPASLAAALAALDGGEAPDLDELGALGVPLAVVGWGDDPGHPLQVARTWAATAARASLVELGLDELDRGVDRLGRAGVEALARVGRWVPRIG